jgi:hypothetical protein
MVKAKHVSVEQVLGEAQDKQLEIVQHLRRLIKEAWPNASEIIRDGKLTYQLNGKDAVAIRIANGHTDLLFMTYRNLDSLTLRGQGTPKDLKHIEVVTLKNFNEAEAKRLLRAEAETLAAIS